MPCQAWLLIAVTGDLECKGWWLRWGREAEVHICIINLFFLWKTWCYRNDAMMQINLSKQRAEIQSILIVTVETLWYSGARIMQGMWNIACAQLCSLCSGKPASSWTSSWLHVGSLPCGTHGKGSCIFPVWEITKMLPCRLLLSPVLPFSRFGAFKECDSWIFSPSEKLCGYSPVRSAWEKQDSSHLIYDVSASDVDNLHLFHSL